MGAEDWLKDCIGPDFDITNYLLDQSHTSIHKGGSLPYSVSLAQCCEYSWYQKLLKCLCDSERLRLLSNSGPTQAWVTALPLSWKHWNLTSREWLIAARRRLGLHVRTKRTRCSNCRFHEIGLKGDHALRCSGRMGLKMRHDAIKVLLARAFKQAGFNVKMEQSGGLQDKRRPADVQVADWLVVNDWTDSKSLSIDVAIIDPMADSHSATLRCNGVGAAATEYETVKRNKYKDIQGAFSPFVLEAHGGFGTAAKKLVKELDRKRRERECRPNVRNTEGIEQLGNISLVTAIGFELVRRNVRMILDRSPKDNSSGEDQNSYGVIKQQGKARAKQGASRFQHVFG